MKAAVTLLVVLSCLSVTVVQGQDGTVTHNEDLWSELMELKVELSKATSKIVTLETWNTALQNDVSALQNDVSALQRENSALQNDVSALQRENSERPKVAFYAGLTNSGFVGPYDSQITLVFKNVVTNIGQAYNRDTGVFRAPVRGVYYFRFTATDFREYVTVCVRLYHNSRQILWNEGKYDDTNFVSISHGVPLELQEGDVVYLKLPTGFGVFDDGGKYTTFSGFLIYPV